MLRIFRHYVSGVSLLLFLGDVAAIAVGFYLAEETGAWVGAGPLLPKAVLVTGAIALTLYLGDLYNLLLHPGRREVIARLLTCQAVAALIIAAAGFALP